MEMKPLAWQCRRLLYFSASSAVFVRKVNIFRVLKRIDRELLGENEIKFLSASGNSEDSDIVLLGIPFDETSTGRRGSNLAPEAIRSASDLIETYSPYLDSDLEDFKITDWGDVGLNRGDGLQAVENALRNRIEPGRCFGFFGGEHSISIPITKILKQVYPGLKILIIDAHCDLRDEYLGSRFNHACTARRIADIVGWDGLKLVGVRSGTKDEFNLAKEHGLLYSFTPESVRNLFDSLRRSPVYLSLDLDVFDPSLVPGTGAPEPGGVSYHRFLEFCRGLAEVNLIGFDLVELCPPVDPSGNSAVVAASAARELMLAMMKGREQTPLSSDERENLH